MKNLKLFIPLLLLSSLFFFSCNKEAEVEKLTEVKVSSSMESTNRGLGLGCNNFEFPYRHSEIANQSNLSDPMADCEDPSNYIPTSGESPLEKYYNCKFDNKDRFPTSPPTNQEGLQCQSFEYIELYRICAEESEFLGYNYFYYPAANPNDADPNYFEFLSDDPEAYKTAQFDEIVDYAQLLIGNELDGTPYAFLDVTFFFKPVDCQTLCGCNITLESDGSETLNGCGDGGTLYVRYRPCQYVFEVFEG